VSIELQKIDCNCNDCKFMLRDLEKYKSYNYIHAGNDGKIVNASRIQYGKCSKFEKEVNFLPNTCQILTQQCFIHRKDV
jgi:hypothetical protein